MNNKLLERLYSTGLLKTAADATQFIKQYEKPIEQRYSDYKEAVFAEREQLNALFPHSANNTVPLMTFEEFKNQAQEPAPKQDPMDYYRNNPEAAHEYVFNMTQSGADINTLPKDIVDIAKKYEEENKENFGEVPVQTPDTLPTTQIDAGFTFNLTKTAADIPQVTAPTPTPDIDQTAYQDIKTRLEAAMAKDPNLKAQLTALTASLPSFKAKTEEILVKENTGLLPPKLSDSGYIQLGKELFNADFSKEAPKPQETKEKGEKDKSPKAPEKEDKGDGLSGLDELLGV